jgi:hypothetical protein
VGAAASNIFVDVATPATLAQAEILSVFGNKGVTVYAIADTAANILAGISASFGLTVSGATSVTVTDTPTLSTLNASILLGYHVGIVYNLSDSATALLATADAVTVQGAHNVTVTNSIDAVTGTALLAKLGVAGHLIYNLVDTAAHLLAAAAATVSGAALVTVSDAVSVATALALRALSTHVNYSLSDTAVNLAAATAALGSGATNITVTGLTTVAQASAIHAFTISGGFSYSLSDTSVNVLAASSVVLTGAVGIVLTNGITAAAALTLLGTTPSASFALSDTAANLAATSANTGHHANLINATGAVNVLQLDAIRAIASAGVLTTLRVVDTAAHVVAAIAAADPALAGAISFAVSDVVTVAQADTIHGFNSVSAQANYAVADSAANVATAMLAHDAALSRATGFTLSGTATVAQADAIHAFNAVSAQASYAVADSAANLIAAINALDAALNSATSMAITGTTTLAQADAIRGYTSALVPTPLLLSYSITDSSSNLLALTSSGQLFTMFGASQVTVTDAPTLSVADVDNLLGLNLNTTFTLGYSLVDTGANLLAAQHATAVTAAAHVTVIDTPQLSIAGAVTLLVTDHAVFPFSYSLFDTGVALAGATATTIHGATAVAASDALLVAQASILHAEIAAGSTLSYDLVDTAAHLAAGTPALISAAGSVTSSDAATVAQATIILAEHPATLSNLTTYSIADASTLVAAALTTGNASLAAVEHATTIGVTDPFVGPDFSPNLTVNANQFGNLLNGTTLLAANDTITIDGLDVNVNLGTLHAFGGDVAAVHAMNLGGVNNGSYTVNMGTSGETAIFMDGTGVQHIVASSSTKEKFIVGIANNGGSTITNLDIADSVDTIGPRTGALVPGAVGSAALVNGVGKWAFTGGVLTWWNQDTNVADHLTLGLTASAHGLVLDNNHHSFTVI